MKKAQSLYKHALKVAANVPTSVDSIIQMKPSAAAGNVSSQVPISHDNPSTSPKLLAKGKNCNESEKFKFFT